MKKRFMPLLLLPTLLLSNPFESTLENEISWLQEETFVISASRVKENIKKTASSITVIDEETIEKMGANNILDVLKIVPGLGITQSNIFANEIESRGIKDWFSKQILFMIDGHSLDVNILNGGPTWNFDKINLDNVKRIEVIKGPASALYGANAFTALINIITKNAEDINGTELSVKGGSNNTKEANILFGKKYTNFSITGNLNVYKSDGDSVYVHKDIVSNSASTNPTRKQIKADLKLQYNDFYLSSMYIGREDGQYFGAIGALNDESKPKSDFYFLELGYDNDISAYLNFNIKAYLDKNIANNQWEIYSEGFPTTAYTDGLLIVNGYTNEKNGVEALWTYTPSHKYTVVAGALYEKHKQYDVITKQNYDENGSSSVLIDFSNDDSITFAPGVDRDLQAIYINNLYDISDNIRLTLGARYDNFSDFGSNISPRGGISWQVNENNIFKLMYGEGFRAPTFAELYNENSPVVNGNPNLKAEEVTTQEMSFDSKLSDNYNVKITYFNNSFTNLIAQEGLSYVNRGETSTEGVELELKYDFSRGSYVRANYTHQKARDELTNISLPDIARNKGNILVNYRVNKYINSFNHLFIKGETQRAFGDTRDNVSAYVVFNTTLMIQNIYKELKLKIIINNLLDEEYYDPSRYNNTTGIALIEEDYQGAGRSFIFESSYKF